MPAVIENTDIQKYTCPASTRDDLCQPSRVLPLSWRWHFPLLAPLRSVLLPLLRLHPTREQARPLRRPKEPEMSMDTLARQYPDIYLQITSWSS